MVGFGPSSIAMGTLSCEFFDPALFGCLDP